MDFNKMQQMQNKINELEKEKKIRELEDQLKQLKAVPPENKQTSLFFQPPKPSLLQPVTPQLSDLMLKEILKEQQEIKKEIREEFAKINQEILALEHKLGGANIVSSVVKPQGTELLFPKPPPTEKPQDTGFTLGQRFDESFLWIKNRVSLVSGQVKLDNGKIMDLEEFTFGIQNTPHLLFPDEKYEVPCDNCKKSIPIENLRADGVSMECAHCKTPELTYLTAIGAPRAGFQWMIFRPCDHYIQVPIGTTPVVCSFCEKEGHPEGPDEEFGVPKRIEKTATSFVFYPSGQLPPFQFFPKSSEQNNFKTVFQ